MLTESSFLNGREKILFATNAVMTAKKVKIAAIVPDVCH